MRHGASRGALDLDLGPPPAEEFGLQGGEGRLLLCPAASATATATIPTSPTLQCHPSFADTATKACRPRMSAPAPNLILAGRNLIPRAEGLLKVTTTPTKPHYL